MSTTRCKSSYGDNGVVNGNGYNSSQDFDERASGDLEVNSPKPQASKKKDDPFGDETKAEVKYRTMAWWLVGFPELPTNDSADSMFTGKLE